MELDPGQLALIGILASVLSQVLRFIAGRLGQPVPSNIQKIIVFVVSLVLAVLWMDVGVDFSSDPMQFAVNLLASAVAAMGAARGIYELLLGRLGLSRLM